MEDETPTGPATHRIRPATPDDLSALAAVEDSGGPQFREHFGADIEPILLSPAVDGRQRAAEPGFLLVAIAGEAEARSLPPGGSTGGGAPRVSGFVHVLEIDGHAHLEQLSVLPERQGQGLGAALVRAAMAEARARGFDRMSLCTYRDVPWNGPFYARLGFAEVDELLPYERRLRETERDLRLDVNGVRVVMSIALR